MKCIILAGGKGTRLQPLTHDTPKPLLPIKGKPALEYTLEALPDEISSVVIAVKYLGFKIKAYFGNTFGDKKIAYVDLITLRGTMDALKQCKKHIKGQTMMLYGDDIYSSEDLANLVKTAKQDEKKWYMLVASGESEKHFGQVFVKDGKAFDIIEANDKRQQKGVQGYVNTGAYILDERIFKYKPIKVPSGEYGLPQTMVQAKKELPLIVVQAHDWTPLNTLEDYKKANGSLF